MPNNDSDIVIVNGIEVDKKRANEILRWLIQKEAENVRTKSLSGTRMVQEIKNRIKEVVEYYQE